MLVISDKGKGGGGVILLAIFLSVCAAAGTTLLVHDSVEHQERSTAPPRLIIPDVDKSRAAEQAATIAELKKTVARLEKALGDAETPAGEPADIDPLLAIAHGERQIAIHDQVASLTRRGDAVVPEVLAALREGRDEDWGGSAWSGNVYTCYPRLRTALMDVLRQIGTPTAKQGLLDLMKEDASPADYGDLLLMYSTTSDPMMIEGIRGLIPGMLTGLRDEEDRYGLLELNLIRWMREQGVSDKSELLAELSLRNLKAGQPDRGAFGLLTETDPEAAFVVVANKLKEDPAAIHSIFRGLWRIPLARVADLYEAMLQRMELDESARNALYSSAPINLCSRIESAEARREDGRRLLALLKRRLQLETEKPKEVLQRRIDALEKAING